MSNVLNSPFRYAGGKFYARDLILPLIPNHESYCEPLCGGASIFFAKSKVKSNWLNDNDEELINCLIHIRDKPLELSNFLAGKKPSKDAHAYYKNGFKPKNDLERAGRWYFLNRISYSGIMNMRNCFWGYGDKYSMQPKNWGRHITRCSGKLQNVKITCQDFESVIDSVSDGSFLFVDPPYFNRDQDKFYTHTFTIDEHKRLADTLRRNKDRIKFLLTYDNDEEIRKMYSWATEILEKEWFYTINRTDDQTKMTNNKGKRYKGKEFFILNFKTPRSQTPSIAHLENSEKLPMSPQ
jgi:DNA adenine methylase